MAKQSAIQKNLKRISMVKRDKEKRAKLKDIIMNKNLSLDERFEAQQKLAALPRNGSKIRIRNRCQLTGRPRGFYRKFKLSRICLRSLAAEGQLPGVVKSSW